MRAIWYRRSHCGKSPMPSEGLQRNACILVNNTAAIFFTGGSICATRADGGRLNPKRQQQLIEELVTDTLQFHAIAHAHHSPELCHADSACRIDLIGARVSDREGGKGRAMSWT